jgi:hypothetical protein
LRQAFLFLYETGAFFFEQRHRKGISPAPPGRQTPAPDFQH